MTQPQARALEGIRVADLTIITAGAAATQMLADLGADVIKIESGSYPDPFRGWQTKPRDGQAPPEDPWNHAPTFNMVNRNKRDVCLDLKTERGRELFLDIVRTSDVVAENFRTGVMARLGLSYDVLREVNPRIVMLSLGSQGSSGPESRYGSYGSTLDALSGLMGITGYTDSAPIWSSGEVNYPDQVAALFGAGIILAALRYRDRAGVGTYIDLSQREMVTTMIGEYALEYTIDGELPKQHGNDHPSFSPNQCYPCEGNNEWVAITVASDTEWQQLVAAIGRDDLAQDAALQTASGRRAASNVIDAAICAWTTGRTKREAMDALQAAGVRAGAGVTGKDMLADPHLNARGYYVPTENYRSGMQTLRLAPYQMSETPPRIERPAPTLGHDTEAVLREVLGLNDADLAALAEQGITNNAPRFRRTR